jgi:hypothetical protein
MAIKCINIFHCKTFKNLSDFGFWFEDIPYVYICRNHGGLSDEYENRSISPTVAVPSVTTEPDHSISITSQPKSKFYVLLPPFFSRDRGPATKYGEFYGRSIIVL